jgi:hypothetical protein
MGTEVHIMTLDDLLACIGSTESSDFNEIWDSLPVGKSGWAELFRLIERAEHEGLVEVSRIKGRIDCAQLTEAGADRIRAKMDARRGLLGYIESR